MAQSALVSQKSFPVSQANILQAGICKAELKLATVWALGNLLRAAKLTLAAAGLYLTTAKDCD